MPIDEKERAKSPSALKKAARDARSAAALRANLRRRKEAPEAADTQIEDGLAEGSPDLRPGAVSGGDT